MTIHKIDRKSILFIIPRKEHAQIWKIEKYFKTKKDLQLRFSQITRDQTAVVSYTKSERYFIDGVIAQYPNSESDPFWTENRIYLLRGNALPGEDIFIETTQGGTADIIVE